MRLTHRRLTPVCQKVREAGGGGSRARARARTRSTGKASGALRVLEMRNVIHFLAKVVESRAEREGEVQSGRLEDEPAFLRRGGGGGPPDPARSTCGNTAASLGSPRSVGRFFYGVEGEPEPVVQVAVLQVLHPPL